MSPQMTEFCSWHDFLKWKDVKDMVEFLYVPGGTGFFFAGVVGKFIEGELEK